MKSFNQYINETAEPTGEKRKPGNVYWVAKQGRRGFSLQRRVADENGKFRVDAGAAKRMGAAGVYTSQEAWFKCIVLQAKEKKRANEPKSYPYYKEYVAFQKKKGRPIVEGDSVALQKKGETTKASFKTVKAGRKERHSVIIAQNPVDKKWYALGGVGWMSISAPMRNKAEAEKYVSKLTSGANLPSPKRSMQDTLKLRGNFGNIISDDPKQVSRDAHRKQKEKSKKK